MVTDIRAVDWLARRGLLRFIKRPFLDDAVANCYPGLELDVRNLDRRFFPGLVIDFVARDDDRYLRHSLAHFGGAAAPRCDCRIPFGAKKR